MEHSKPYIAPDYTPDGYIYLAPRYDENVAGTDCVVKVTPVDSPNGKILMIPAGLSTARPFDSYPAASSHICVQRDHVHFYPACNQFDKEEDERKEKIHRLSRRKDDLAEKAISALQAKSMRDRRKVVDVKNACVRPVAVKRLNPLGTEPMFEFIERSSE